MPSSCCRRRARRPASPAGRAWQLARPAPTPEDVRRSSRGLRPGPGCGQPPGRPGAGAQQARAVQPRPVQHRRPRPSHPRLAAAATADQPGPGRRRRRRVPRPRRRAPAERSRGTSGACPSTRRSSRTGSAVTASRPAVPRRPGAAGRPPADGGWDAAKTVLAPASSGVTTAGLPVRAPRANLVPGAIGSPPAGRAPRPARSADAARNRLAGFQRGASRGRAASSHDGQDADPLTRPARPGRPAA